MSWRLWRNTYFQVFLTLTILAFAESFLMPKNVFAEDEISISFSSATISLDLAPNQFGSSSKDFSVSTTSPAGYTVSLSTAGSSTALVAANSELQIPTFSFPSGVDKLPAESVGYGYGYSTDGGTYYSPVPDPLLGGVKIFSTNESGTYDHELTFGAKAHPDTVAERYANTFVITATVNNAPVCPANTICYRGNGDDESGKMHNQTVSSSTSVMLISPNFSRSGYGFAGWNTKADGTGTDYGASETITVDDLSSSGLVLYAKWTRATTIMQNWTGCSSLSIGDVVALKDFRDDNSYAVAKLADGKCWMVENMRINPASANITAANTNSPTESFMESATVSSSSNNNCTSDTSECIDTVSYNLNNLDRNLNASYDTNSVTSAWYSYGGMYNWYTATAGNGTYNTLSAVASGDICPAGWKLPTGNNRNGDWDTLNTVINNSFVSDTGLRTYPNNLIYSGDFNGSAPTGRGYQGRFWSSTSVANAKAARFGYRSNSTTPSNSYNKWANFSIRCLVKDDNASIIGNIHYDANGGTGTMANTTNVNLYTTAATANAFVSTEGYSFHGWNTRADGTGTFVANEDLVAEAAKAEQISPGGTLTLYAMWGTFAHLDYDANGGKGAPNAVTKVGEDTWNFTISSITPTRIDHTFLGWSTDQSATAADYLPGETFSTNNQDNTLYAVWYMADCPSDYICYRGNGADTGSSINQSASSGSSVRLYSANYSRDGYGFASWNTKADGTGTDYGPSQNITVGDLSGEGLILYAKWIASRGNLQNWSGCNAMLTGDITALTDLRDGNTYTVAKLTDGHCWMAENLRLVPSTTNFNLTNTNSPTQDFIDNAPHSTSTTKMCNTASSECIDKVTFDTNNIMSSLTASPTVNNSNSSWYSYGVLYNWYTATAGNGTFSMAEGSTTGDICPAGWRLPTGGDNGEFKALNNAVNMGITNDDTGLLAYPVNIVYSGDHNASNDGGRGLYTRLWSSTANNATNAYRMGLSYSGVTPTRSYSKWDAFAVRCVAK